MAWVTTLDAWVRLLIAALLGSGVGLERELTGQPAGLRTHTLVALGSALFTTVGLGYLGPAVTPDGRADSALRVVAALVTGVGFLGAGAIIRARGTVQGLTTAASLWVTAAIGLGAGSGFYALAAGATVLVLAVLRGLEWLKERAGLPVDRG